MIKKILGFIVLFGIGIGALILIDRRTTRSDDKVTDTASPSPGTSAPDPIGDDETFSLTPSGRFRIDLFGEADRGRSPRQGSIIAEDSAATDNGALELRDLEIEMFDVNDSTLVAKVIAARGVTQFTQSKGSLNPTIGDQIELFDVEVQLLSGSRLVPVTLTSAELLCDYNNLRFEAPGRARIEGSGIEAEGDGLVLDETEGLITFSSNANAMVRAQALEAPDDGEVSRAQPGRLACAGRLTIRQPPGVGRRPVIIRAEQRALLAVEGGDGLSLEAHQIQVNGVVDEDRGVFAFERLDADREVQLRAKGHRFSSSKARFELGEQGNLERASLVGNPSGILALDESAGDLSEELVVGIDLEPGDGRVKVWGEGPMNLTWTPDAAFQISGPAQLRWRDAELWAAGGIAGNPSSGSSEPGAQAGRFRAWSGIQLDINGWTLKTDELVGDAEGASLALDTDGLSRVSGTTKDGADLELIARSGFEFKFDGDEWNVPEARDVDLVFSGARPLSASAEKLVNFEPEQPSFEGLGSVALNQGADFLRGDKLYVKGNDYLRIEGSAEEPVEFDSAIGRITANLVERSGASLVAREDVHAEIRLPGFAATLDTDSLQVEGNVRREVDAEPTLDGPLVVIAEGNVHAIVDGAFDDYDLTGDNLRIEREQLLPTDVESAAQSESGPRFRTKLAARGSVLGTLVGQLGDLTVQADEVDGQFEDPFETAADAEDEALIERSVGFLDARGSVEIRKLDSPPLNGRCDVFHVQSDRTGRLQSTSDEKVRSKGYLPGTGEPFRMQAKLIEFGPERISADDVDILITDREGSADEERGQFALKELLARAERLVADESSVLFERDVRFDGQTPDERTWMLDAEMARFDNSLGEKTTTGVFDRLIAEDRVRLSFSDGLEVTGNYLSAEAWSGRVRIEGTPARLFDTTPLQSIWFEVDTRTNLFSSGPGYAGIGLDGEGGGSDDPLESQR